MGASATVAPVHRPVPSMVYGTAWKKAETARLVELAIRTGFRGIDTACQPKHYDEPGVGAGIAACLGARLQREELYLQTKFTSVPGQDPARIPYDASAPLAAQIEQSFAASQRNLRSAFLDCLVLHSPMPSARETLSAWRVFESLTDAGLVGTLGISNCYRLAELELLYGAARIKPAVVQNRFYAQTGYDREIRAFCTRHGIVYQSFWTLSANPQLLAHAAIQRPAAIHGRSPAQILFRYLTQSGVVPLTGTRSEAHMREDLSIFDFELGAGERLAIDALLAG